MKRNTFTLACILLLSLVVGSAICHAQDDNPNQPSSRSKSSAPNSASSSLSITADGDYKWILDKKPHGSIHADDPAVIIAVASGPHTIAAESTTGGYSFSRSVMLRPGQNIAVRIAQHSTGTTASATRPGAPQQSSAAASTASAPSAEPTVPKPVARSVPPPVQQPDTAATKHQAVALYDQQRYAEAVPLYEQACNAGDMDACNTLGNMYQHHQGVAQSYGKAVSLYTSACNAGYALACSNLGMIHLTVSQDYDKAFSLFTQACTAGNQQGCYNLGYVYQNGYGTEKDLPHASRLYSQACDGGVANGCNSLGSLYYGGSGVPQDYGKAVANFTKACDAGNDAACRNLAICYRDGLGVSRNTDKARELFNKACTMGFQQACAAASNL